MDFKIHRSFEVVNGRTVSAVKSITAERSGDLEVAIAEDATDFEVAWPIDVSELEAFYLMADRDLTIDVNEAGSAPDQTINFKANQAIEWCKNDTASNPLEQDVTKIFVTNGSGVATTLYGFAPTDATPS